MHDYFSTQRDITTKMDKLHINHKEHEDYETFDRETEELN